VPVLVAVVGLGSRVGRSRGRLSVALLLQADVSASVALLVSDGEVLVQTAASPAARGVCGLPLP